MEMWERDGGLRWTDMQRYSSSSVSFVPCGRRFRLQMYLKCRQERVSGGADAALCCLEEADIYHS